MPELPVPQPLSDAVVLLRVMDDGDAPRFAAASADPLVRRFAYARTFDEESALEYLRDINDVRRPRGEAIQFAIEDQVSRELCGALLLFRADHDRGVISLGFWLFENARGRGFARRSIALAFDWACSLGFARMEAETDVANVAAQAAMRRAGFVDEGIARGYNPGPEGRIDYVRFGRLADDAQA